MDNGNGPPARIEMSENKDGKLLSQLEWPNHNALPNENVNKKCCYRCPHAVSRKVHPPVAISRYNDFHIAIINCPASDLYDFL